MGISSVPNLGDAFLPLALLPLLLLKDGFSWAILHVIGGNGAGSHEDTADDEAAGLRVMPAEWIRPRRQQGEKEWCCSVCLQGVEKEEVSQIVACGHLFHRSCLRRWLMVGVGNTCPLCRSTLQ